jgi:hypothetical protein
VHPSCQTLGVKTTATIMNRRLTLFSVVTLVAPKAFAQDAFTYEVVRDFELPRERIFDTALLWLAESTRSSKSVIDLKDKDLGTIIGNATTSLNIGWGTNLPMSFKLRIDVKDGKYRLTFSQVLLDFDRGYKPLEQANRASLEPKVQTKLVEFAESFHAYLVSASKAKPW